MAGGDQLALRALYDRAHRTVFTLVYRMTGNRDTADELTVDVFHEAWRRAGAYDPADGPVLGWLCNQARSRAIDRLRFEHRHKRSGELPAQPDAVAEPPEHAVDRGERAAQLQHALHLLTPDERQAIEAAYFGQLVHREVAQRLQLPLGTIKSRIRSGLAKLRQSLDAGRRVP
jgi:RNA polymerase sigma-70 factor (ECF subfamily)